MQPASNSPEAHAARFLAPVLAAHGRSFRGGILDCIRTAPMGKGHKNDGQPFDIETACYLKPVFARILHPRSRIIPIKAGVKTMKTFVVETACIHHTCHGIGDANLYFGTGELADDQAKTRFMDYARGVAAFAEKLATVPNRFDVTTTLITFADKTLRLLPANLSSTQGFNLCFVGICDAFLTANTGMIQQAIARTTQYPQDKKVIVESQGGETGFDFDALYEDSTQEELHVICPHCDSKHIFNWKAYDLVRPDDFRAVPPKGIPSLDHAAWSDHYSVILKAEARKHAGFKRGPDELIKRPSGEIDDSAVLREAYFECYHCGSAWRDLPPVRAQLDESSFYVPARPEAREDNPGFNFPQWINRRLPWGEIVLAKLKAQKVFETTGNIEPLKQWWQKVAARTWDTAQMTQQRDLEIATGSYETDPDKLMPDFHSRNMTADAQKKLDADANEDVVGSFWYVVREWDKQGNSRQLARGFAASWEELLQVQKFWKVPNQRFCIDSSKWTPQIMNKAAMEFELVTPAVPHPLTGRKDPYPSCWRLFFGDARATFKVKGRESAFSEGQPTPPFTVHGQNGNRYLLRLFKYRWSNLAFELQLDAILSRTPGMPRFESLPREALPAAIREKETGILTYDQQMSARYLTLLRGKQHFEDIKNREAHYRDCELMQLVRAAQDGLLGHVNPVTDEGEEQK